MGSMPPRSSTAILWASILSFLALPPWIAFMYRACPGRRQCSVATEVGEPVPGEHALHCNRDVFSVRSNRFQEQFRGASHVSVQQDLALRIQDTDVHRSGVQIDSAVVSVLVSVKSHMRSPPSKSVFGKHEHTKWYAQGGGLNEYQSA